MRRFFFTWTDACHFVVLLTLSTTMSGIVNLGQNCFVNALMQCFSVNQSMVNALEVHSRHHDTVTSKYNISEIFNRRLQCETSPIDFSGHKFLKENSKHYVSETDRPCVLCVVYELLVLLRSPIPTTVDEEFVTRFCQGRFRFFKLSFRILSFIGNTSTLIRYFSELLTLFH